MNVPLSNSMREATRLTREGRLTEASALLQRLLRGESEAAASAPDTAGLSAVGHPRILDMNPETGELLEPAPTREKAFAAGWRTAAGRTPPAMPEALRGLLDQAFPKGVPQGGQGPMAGQASQMAEPVPEGAEFVAGFVTDHGRRLDYKLYVPSTYQGRAVPLVVMLHGCTQSPDDFAAGTRMNALAEEHACLIAYPGQSQSANAQKCWNWFKPGDQQREQGEPALIAGITRQIMRSHAVDPRRVYIAGLSAGGAAAAIMAQAYPDLYAAVGVHSGLACGAARDIPSAFAAMRQGAAVPPQPGHPGPAAPRPRIVPTIVFHADQDRTVHPRNGDQVIAQSSASGVLRVKAVQNGQVPGGHAYRRTIYADTAGKPLLEQWLVHGGGHAWSGGSPAGTYTDARGPDASREMLRFFLEHPKDSSAG